LATVVVKAALFQPLPEDAASKLYVHVLSLIGDSCSYILSNSKLYSQGASFQENAQLGTGNLPEQAW
jgi:hypothetical protein